MAYEQRLYIRDKSRPKHLTHHLRFNEAYSQNMKLSNRTSSIADISSPSPYTGSTTSTYFNAQHFKDDIMTEIRSELSEPIKEELSKVLEEIRKLRQRVGMTHECTNVSCQTEVIEEHRFQSGRCEANSAAPNQPGSLRSKTSRNALRNCMETRQLSVSSTEYAQNVSESEHTKATDNDKSLTEVKQVVHLPGRMKENSRTSTALLRNLEVQHTFRIHMADERECLSNSLQFHIQELVDGLVFCKSELSDRLLAEGCLTEDECCTVRKLDDRKDQMRVLLTLIKGRDLRVLETFMKHVDNQNPDVARKIKEKFESNKHEGVKGTLCPLCQLERQFNVKHVVDSLWSIQAIDDELYSQAINSDTPVGAQSQLWKQIFHSLNCLNNKKAELAHQKLLQAIVSRNMFTYIAKGIRVMLIRNYDKLTCSCEPTLSVPNRDSFIFPTLVESFIPPGSRSSDVTSHDTTSQDGRLTGRCSDRITKISDETIVMSAPDLTTSAEAINSETEKQDNKTYTLRKKQVRPTKNMSDKTSMKSLSDNDSHVQTTISMNLDLSINPFHKPLPKKTAVVTEMLTNDVSTSTLLRESIAKDKTNLDTQDNNVVISDIPAQPPKKNKFPALELVTELEPSYV